MIDELGESSMKEDNPKKKKRADRELSDTSFRGRGTEAHSIRRGFRGAKASNLKVVTLSEQVRNLSNYEHFANPTPVVITGNMPHIFQSATQTCTSC